MNEYKVYNLSESSERICIDPSENGVKIFYYNYNNFLYFVSKLTFDELKKLLNISEIKTDEPVVVDNTNMTRSIGHHKALQTRSYYNTKCFIFVSETGYINVTLPDEAWDYLKSIVK